MMRNARNSTDIAAAEDHCAYCFDVIVAHLGGDTAPDPWFEDGSCPLFVTWTKRRSSSATPQLRGCIGTLEPRRLHTALKDYALTSALRDSRFSPVRPSEVPALTCGVSLLGGFGPAGDHLDWEVGVHGLVARFDDPQWSGLKRSATFLPEVAAEQGWSKVATIDALIRKAGFDGAITPELRSSLSLTRYTSTKASLSYEHYLAAKGAAGADQASGLAAAADTVVVYA